MPLRNCDVCAARNGVGDPRNWHDLEQPWPSQCMGHYQKRAQKHGDGPTYMPDIQPFKSPIDGHVVNSRREWSMHKQMHGVIEVGNEKMPEKKYEPPPPPGPDIARAMQEHGFWKP